MQVWSFSFMPFHIILFHPALTNLLLFVPVHANLFINSFCLPLTAASSFQPPPLVLVTRPPETKQTDDGIDSKF